MEHYDPKSVPPPNGFFNTGAICYWNALIQSLVSLPAFNRALLANEDKLSKNEIASAIINYLKESFESTDDVETNTRKFANRSNLVLKALVAKMRKTHRFTNLEFGQRQESASEGFVLLIDMLNSKEIERVFHNRYSATSWCDTCKKTIMDTTDMSFQINMFFNNKPTDAESFKNQILKYASVHEGYKCEECDAITEKGSRHHSLKMLREVVVIEFNKYMIKDMRWFPEEMEFPSTYAKPLKYKLISIIEHSGGLSGGHYWCRAWRPTSPTDGKFYKFNDESVSDADSSPSTASYMLFYHVVAQ